MFSIFLLSTDFYLKEIIQKFGQKYNIEVFIAYEINNAIELSLSNYPFLNIIDTDLDNNIYPYQFVYQISKIIDSTHSNHPYIFISNMDTASIENTKKALNRVRNGNLFIKGIDPTLKEKFYNEILLEIEKVYTIYNNNKVKNSISKNKTDINNFPEKNNNIDPVLNKIKKEPIKVIVIGISAGGPSTLTELFSYLTNIPLPIIIVQHTIPDFQKEYVTYLQKKNSLPINIAKQGEILQNKIYFTPDHTNIKLSYINSCVTVLLEYNTNKKGYIPSIDITFESILKENIACLGILMTGLGTDGVNTLKLMHTQGYPVIAQSSKDAKIFAMPSALIKKEGVDSILTIDLIAKTINLIKDINHL